MMSVCEENLAFARTLSAMADLTAELFNLAKRLACRSIRWTHYASLQRISRLTPLALFSAEQQAAEQQHLCQQVRADHHDPAQGDPPNPHRGRGRLPASPLHSLFPPHGSFSRTPPNLSRPHHSEIGAHRSVPPCEKLHFSQHVPPALAPPELPPPPGRTVPASRPSNSGGLGAHWGWALFGRGPACTVRRASAAEQLRYFRKRSQGGWAVTAAAAPQRGKGAPEAQLARSVGAVD
jgi:hypothetical protein